MQQIEKFFKIFALDFQKFNFIVLFQEADLKEMRVLYNKNEMLKCKI